MKNMSGKDYVARMVRDARESRLDGFDPASYAIEYVKNAMEGYTPADLKGIIQGGVVVNLINQACVVGVLESSSQYAADHPGDEVAQAFAQGVYHGHEQALALFNAVMPYVGSYMAQRIEAQAGVDKEFESIISAQEWD